MTLVMQQWWLLILILAALQLTQAQERGYIFVAPKSLHSGSNATFCFYFNNIKNTDAVVTVRLLKDANREREMEEVLATHKYTIPSVESDTWQCSHDFSVPFKDSNSYFQSSIHVNVVFPSLQDEYTINETKKIDFQHDDRLFFIETDKDKYKLGQKVHFRFLNLDKNLKPKLDPISEVWIEDPNAVRMAQWKNVQMDRGLAQLEFKIADDPVQGSWKIKVNRGSAQDKDVRTQYFTIEEYTLPKFSVTIKPQRDSIYKTDTDFTWTICAKYTHGEPVVGKFSAEISGRRHYYGPFGPPPPLPRPPPPPVPLGELPDGVMPAEPKIDPKLKRGPFSGCEDVTFSSEALNLTAQYRYSIDIFAEVTEKGTGIKQFVTEYTRIQDETSRIRVQLKDYDFPYFKPGLSFCDELSVNEGYNKPLAGQDVRVCVKYLHNKNDTLPCKDYTSDKNGIVTVKINPVLEQEVDNETRVELEYEVHIPSQNDTIYLRRKVWYSPSYSFMQLYSKEPKPLKCDKIHSFWLNYTPVKKDTMANVMILSKGEILRSFPVILSLNDEVYQPSPDALELNEERISLPVLYKSLDIIVTPDMSPKFSILIHYTRDDGEVIADSLDVDVDSCLQNLVLMKWNRKRPSPGSDIDLSISAAPNSLCGVSVVDKSVKLLSSNNQLKLDRVKSARSNYHLMGYSYPRQVDDWEYCYNNTVPWRGRRKRSSPPRRWHDPTDHADSIFAFDHSGLVVMSDMTLETRPCYPASRLRPEVQFAAHPAPSAGGGGGGAPRVRTYFPETWLSQLEDIGEGGLLRKTLKVPDTITEWISAVYCISQEQGFGMADARNFIAFSHFFIDYTMPFSVIRGETFPLKVSMFNYVKQRLPIKLELVRSPELEVVDGNYIRNFWLGAEESDVFVFNVTASKIGHVKIRTQAFVAPEMVDSAVDSGHFLEYSDAIERKLLVEPEGFPQEKFHSEYVCVKGGETKIQELSCVEPANTVPDSARAKFSVSGSLMGSVLQNLDRLIVLPTGCGEQNMARLVPNIHGLSYLKSINSEDEKLKSQSVSNMQTGYQRQLKYKHKDGSYSAFGDKGDTVGSIWLTAFVLKSFSQAEPHVYIDEKILKQAREFIVTKQLENGCFPAVGKVFSKSLKGGVGDDNPTLLTAYILTSLLEAKEPPFNKIVENSLTCLNPKNIPQEPYAEAISAYAWMLAYKKGKEAGGDPAILESRKSMGIELLNRLKASQIVEHGTISWRAPDCTYSCDAVNVETAGYVLLAEIIHGIDKGTLRGIGKYLLKKKNFHGSYYSTQDTVIAVEALSKFGELFEDVPLTKVDVKTIGNTFTVTKDNKLLNQEVSTGAKFMESVEITGSGCALVQCTLKFNTIEPEHSPAFNLEVVTRATTRGSVCGDREVEICVRYILDDLESNMAVVEFSLASGYVADTNKLDALTNDVNVELQRWELKDNKINLYFDSLSNVNKCFSVFIKQEVEVKNPKPANIKVYDFYSPQYTNSKSYTVCDEAKSAAPAI